MKQYKHREFVKIVESNGYSHSRTKGSHSIYYNEEGNHISIPSKLNCTIAHRLIKENHLNIK